jgi:hypothetical protein
MKSNRPVWIDTDVALGGERGDVDDGLALAALFGAARRGTTTLAGISTVFGNTSSRLSEGFARRLADVAGIDPVIVCGAERPGETTEAARRISSLGSGRAPDAPDTGRIPLPDRIRSRSCLETVPGARWRVNAALQFGGCPDALLDFQRIRSSRPTRRGSIGRSCGRTCAFLSSNASFA